MKPSRPLLIIACFSIICALFSGVASALEQNEARVTPIWSNETPSPGSTVTVEIFFISDYSEELTIYRVGIHFDWMDPDNFVGYDISDNPVTIPSYESYRFQPINILIPQDVSVGTHSYFVGIDGVQGESTTFSWDSQTRTFQIQESGEETGEVNNGGTSVKSQGQDPLIIIVGVAVVVGVAVLIVILIFRRKRKQTAPVNHPTET